LASKACRIIGRRWTWRTLKGSNPAGILESWFISIRNQAKTSEADETRWQVGLSFVPPSAVSSLQSVPRQEVTRAGNDSIVAGVYR
jgi:hypothetical protein